MRGKEWKQEEGRKRIETRRPVNSDAPLLQQQSAKKRTTARQGRSAGQRHVIARNNKTTAAAADQRSGAELVTATP